MKSMINYMLISLAIIFPLCLQYIIVCILLKVEYEGENIVEEITKSKNREDFLKRIGLILHLIPFYFVFATILYLFSLIHVVVKLWKFYFSLPTEKTANKLKDLSKV